jgi:hypothetical protein
MMSIVMSEMIFRGLRMITDETSQSAPVLPAPGMTYRGLPMREPALTLAGLARAAVQGATIGMASPMPSLIVRRDLRQSDSGGDEMSQSGSTPRLMEPASTETLLEDRHTRRIGNHLLLHLGIFIGMLLALGALFTELGSAWLARLVGLAGCLALTVVAMVFVRAVKRRGRLPVDVATLPRETIPAFRLRKVGEQQPLLQTPGGKSGDGGQRVPDYHEVEETLSPHLRSGDLVLVEAGQLIPADGAIVAGAASIDEAAHTGESAPVLREAEGSDPAVRAGTRVVSGCIVVSVAGQPTRLR